MSRRYIPLAVRRRVTKAANHRCGYCLSAQKYVMGQLELEHLIPLAQGGTDDELNLWLSCGLCNGHKGVQIAANDPETGIEVPLFNPRTQVWADHFRWDEAGVCILGLTPIGRATVVGLQMNSVIAVKVRRHWVLAGIHQ